jgi:Na+-transporting methylmalonyl-CoA/oxaloacetate decarboxylase gamma subunit
MDEDIKPVLFAVGMYLLCVGIIFIYLSFFTFIISMLGISLIYIVLKNDAEDKTKEENEIK